MLQYLIVLLSDNAPSYCYYDNSKKGSKRLMSLDTLKKTICFAMKENLVIQYVFPENIVLPSKYNHIINSIDNHKITGCNSPYISNADIIICNTIDSLIGIKSDKPVVLRISKNNLFSNFDVLAKHLSLFSRLNIIITDIQTFTDKDYHIYQKGLEKIIDIIKNNKGIQFNLLTDRIQLDKMNNCSAGITNITIAPNGRFYLCPAFYNDDENSDIGNIENGVRIPNKNLLQLNYSPICRHCDCYQCKRCVWLNQRTTNEINTPSHQQCVTSHIERNSSLKLLLSLSTGISQKDINLFPINYLDPFEIRHEWDHDVLQEELIKFHKENY